jgi:hypothetical protein
MSLLQAYHNTIINDFTIEEHEGFNFKIDGKCQNRNVLWGSEKPLKETCKPENIQMEGTPCMNIWNNSTKRKIIVDNKYNG